MSIAIESLHAVFVEVRKVREAIDGYCLAPDKVPVSIDDILYAINEVYRVKVTPRLVPLDSKLLRGMIEIYQNIATVFVDASLNLGGTRYVLVKEACHVMLMNAENCTGDPTAIIEYFVQDGLLTSNGAEPPADVLCEELTKFGAVELLFPHDLRQPARTRLEAGQDTLFTLAEWLQIPEHLVEFALSDRYMAMCRRLRESMPEAA